MNKVFVALAGASALVVSTAGLAGGPTTAANAPVDHSAGFYVNGNAGYGHVDTPNIVDKDLKFSRNSFAWSGNVGYQFNPYIAVEAGYMALPYTKAKSKSFDTVNLATNSTVKGKTDAITVAAKGIYPINQQVDLFGKAGLAYLSRTAVVNVNGNVTSTKIKGNHITPLFGLGVDYNLTQNWAVNVQGVTTLKSGDGFPATYTALAGLTYKFS